MNPGSQIEARHFVTGLIVVLAGLVMPAALAEATSNPKNIYQTDPAFQELMASVTFWVNFDKSAEPIMGHPNPDPATTAPKGCELAPGIVGKAFLSREGTTCCYHAPGNLDFSKPGALSFWICPVDWRPGDNEPYLNFFTTSYSAKGYLGIERQGQIRENGVLKRAAELLLFIVNFPDARGNTILSAGNPPTWKNGGWHFFALNWRGSVFELALDGEPFRSVDVGRTLRGDEASTFSIGGCAEPTLIDEFMIYNRPLQEPETAAIHKALNH